MSNIANTAVIKDGAIIEEGVEIGDFAYIGGNVKIEKGVKVFQGAQVRGDTVVGENTQIHSYAVVGNVPQDVSYKGICGELIIGKNNIIREFVSHIAHDCVLGNNIILANNATLAGHVEIGDHVVVGGLTPIHQFVKIGEYAMIGGASALSQDIPPYCLAEGNRAKIKGLNLVGLRRKLEKNDIDALKKAYKEIFRGNKQIKEVAQEILEKETNEKVQKLCNFILQTTRGIPFERNKI